MKREKLVIPNANTLKACTELERKQRDWAFRALSNDHWMDIACEASKRFAHECLSLSATERIRRLQSYFYARFLMGQDSIHPTVFKEDTDRWLHMHSTGFLFPRDQTAWGKLPLNVPHASMKNSTDCY